jgi:UDP-N-acetylmuramoyl-tripeptide--D-alanyl-D-alanine ligase
MGMSAHGHINNLVKIIPPDLSIVTRIAPAGMEGFDGGLNAIARAKGEIFSRPKTQLGLISRQAATYEAICESGHVEKQVYEIHHRVEKGIFVKDSPLLPLNLKVDHLIENAVGAISAARMLGLSWSEIASKTGELKPFDKRFEVLEKGGVTFVQDCYNANPDSVIAALRNLPKVKGRAFGVLGTMPDLGRESQNYHYQVGLEAIEHLDELLCIGEETGKMYEAFSTSGKPVSHYFVLSEVEAVLESKLREGDVVLVKGANFLKLWSLMEDFCCCS